MTRLSLFVARASWPPSGRSVKGFAFGLAFFLVGEGLFAASFVVAAQGSMDSGIPSLLGLVFMLGGLIVGSGRYAT